MRAAELRASDMRPPGSVKQAIVSEATAAEECRF